MKIQAPGSKIKLPVWRQNITGRVSTHRIGTISGIDPGPIEQEADRARGFALTLAKGIHELRKGSGAFDFEEDFIIVVRDFNVEVLRLRLVIRVASSTRGLVVVRHRVCCISVYLCCCWWWI